MRRATILGAGLALGVAAAQVPAFTQAYLQRLGGAYDALSEVVADFDASARAAGLTRQDALAQMTGTAFLKRRQSDMARTFERHMRLGAALEGASGRGALGQSLVVLAGADREIAQAAFAAFRPTMPLDADGVLFGAGGAFLGGGLVAGLWRRKRQLA